MKKILSVEFDIPGYSETSYISYSSSQSLLDADIIVFEPSFNDYQYDYDSPSYQGKTLYREDDSFRLQEDTDHWREELSMALESGKTVFVFLRTFEEVYLLTGGKQYSGTGRNTRTTRIVNNFDNYRFLPVNIPSLIPKEGQQIKFVGNSIFNSYWRTFEKFSKYESYIDGNVKEPLFSTKNGERPVGCLIKVGKGNLVLLPALNWPKSFTKSSKWTDEAVKFGKNLHGTFVEIDKSLRSQTDSTPPPPWVQQERYLLNSETILKVKVAEINAQLEALQLTKNDLSTQIIQEGLLKDLLFEKGKRLEQAVISGLVILGYKAENYNDGNLELDQVILSPEGERFIGECEGKDDTHINIDKFRQLESNIQADFSREEIKEPATGILFGNGFRLTEPDKRAEQFTDKCIANAKRLNCILIKTTDLFSVCKYIKDTADQKFAKDCREALQNSTGKIVKFPEIPRTAVTAEPVVAETAG